MSELPLLPPRPSDAHKGTFGRVLLVGGSHGMAGSIGLSAMAAMRSGAGLVHVAVPDRILETVAGFEPCAMTHGLPCDEAGRLTFADLEDVTELLAGKTAVGIGPGFSRTGQASLLAVELVRSVAQPMVVDADALYGLGDHLDALEEAAGPRVLTPHPGEFARLTGEDCPRDGHGRQRAAEEFAKRFANVTVVLKGAGTVIADGHSESVTNRNGNPGMATAGTGDVLTGVVTALLAQGMTPFDAAVLGVYAHGRAGDRAASKTSETGLVATHLVEQLPRVWKRLEKVRVIWGWGDGLCCLAGASVSPWVSEVRRVSGAFLVLLVTGTR